MSTPWAAAIWKTISEELNLLFGNIFGPGEMLALRGDIFVSLRKHGLLETQKTCLLSGAKKPRLSPLSVYI